jgi:hypothetical protein
MHAEPLMPAAGNHIYYTHIVDVLPAIILRHVKRLSRHLAEKKTTISPTD